MHKKSNTGEKGKLLSFSSSFLSFLSLYVRKVNIKIRNKSAFHRQAIKRRGILNTHWYNDKTVALYFAINFNHDFKLLQRAK